MVRRFKSCPPHFLVRVGSVGWHEVVIGKLLSFQRSLWKMLMPGVVRYNCRAGETHDKP